MSELAISTTPAARRSSLVDWSLRLILALVFVYQGMDKFGSRRLWIRVFSEIGVGQWFRYATGAVEIIGAILMMIPKATVVSVALLACTMVGALLTQIAIIGAGPQTVLVSVLLALILAVGWRRRQDQR
jgi:uncharacterized membrane protein YphA (DoxX/SURF4 family)